MWLTTEIDDYGRSLETDHTSRRNLLPPLQATVDWVS